MNSRRRGCKTITPVTNISFQRLGLTCVSYMEQNAAGREAEVGNVGSELKPLDEKGNKRQCDIHPLQELQTKGLKNCLPPNTQ